MMLPPQVLLDTDILSAYMRREPIVVKHIQDYLRVYDQFDISVLTGYEIVRGLKARGATTKITQFRKLRSANNVLPLTDDIIERATDIYADLHRRGELIGEMDTLIAATALVYDLVVVTNNERHFNRIPGLQIDNWLK